MVLYALGVNEHSAFVKGKNLYIRFKNFPTGPTKVIYITFPQFFFGVGRFACARVLSRFIAVPSVTPEPFF